MAIAISKAEARRLVDEIREHAEGLRGLLVRLHDGEGWRALGYDTWAGCCQEELGYTKRYANYLIQAERVQERVGTIVPEASVPEAQARELTRLPEDQQGPCWQDYQEECVDQGEKPTAAGLREKVGVWSADNEPPDIDGDVIDVEPEPPPHDGEDARIARIRELAGQLAREKGAAVAAAILENVAEEIRNAEQ